ncbi:MAG TPA: hypothetical protein VG982_02890 [Candidatus Paceibacterota bacterium]|jgi:hypothetical protein|nr:hypothetical protein [Candidatus Paceibacterota bacterium]
MKKNSTINIIILFLLLGVSVVVLVIALKNRRDISDLQSTLQDLSNQPTAPAGYTQTNLNPNGPDYQPNRQ